MNDLLRQLNDPAARTLAGFLAAAIVSLAAMRAHALAPSGAIAATIVGGTIVATGGWWLGATLVLYFATSSALSRLTGRNGAAHDQARGSRRDAVQVLANGGVPVAFALISLAPASPSPWLIGAIGAIAGAAADTWATEIGRLSKGNPRLVTTGKSVAPGTSGAVSFLGTSGALAASVLIALAAAIGHAAGWLDIDGGTFTLVLVVTGAGLAGCLGDSLLGATIQQRRWCPSCGVFTERAIHTCGTPTVHRSGLRWMNNDAVNALGILVAGIVAAGCAALVGT